MQKWIFTQTFCIYCTFGGNSVRRQLLAFEATVMGFMRTRGLDPTAETLAAMLANRDYDIPADELARQMRDEEMTDPGLTGAISAVLKLDADEIDELARAIFRHASASANPPVAPPVAPRVGRPPAAPPSQRASGE